VHNERNKSGKCIDYDSDERTLDERDEELLNDYDAEYAKLERYMRRQLGIHAVHNPAYAAYSSDCKGNCEDYTQYIIHNTRHVYEKTYKGVDICNYYCDKFSLETWLMAKRSDYAVLKGGEEVECDTATYNARKLYHTLVYIGKERHFEDGPLTMYGTCGDQDTCSFTRCTELIDGKECNAMIPDFMHLQHLHLTREQFMLFRQELSDNMIADGEFVRMFIPDIAGAAAKMQVKIDARRVAKDKDIVDAKIAPAKSLTHDDALTARHHQLMQSIEQEREEMLAMRRQLYATRKNTTWFNIRDHLTRGA
jgi:hypothetical protein